MSNSNVRLRPFCFQDDYQAVYELWTNAGTGVHTGRSDTPEEILKKVQRDPDLFIVAELEGQIVGAVMGGFDGRRGIVYHLAVEYAYRNQGIGSVLMEELERLLRLKGCLKSYLLVTQENDPAMKFYEEHGWERMNLLIYGKDL